MTTPVLLSTFLVSSALALPDEAIWTGKLANGWQDWSWAKVNKSGPTMKVVAKNWEGVYFHHAPQKSTFGTFAFTVNAGAKGGQRLQVRATVDKKPLKEAYLPALKPGWQTITVRFKSLGLTGQMFDGVWIQSQAAGSFELKNVKLMGG